MAKESLQRVKNIGRRFAIFGVAISAAVSPAATETVFSGDDGIDESFETPLAFEMQQLTRDVYKTEWRREGMKIRVAVTSLPEGHLAITERKKRGECFILYDRSVEDWSSQKKREIAIHEAGHCDDVLYSNPNGGVTNHNPFPASIMHSPYIPGGNILDSDRAALRPFEITIPNIAR